jgi:hypothetical protein
VFQSSPSCSGSRGLVSFVFLDFPDEKLSGVCSRTLLEFFSSLTPVIAKRVSKELSVLEVVSRRDRAWAWLRALKLAFIVLVPEEVAAILTNRGECVKLLVERYPVDRVHLGRLRVCGIRGIINSVALKAEVFSASL